MRSNVQCIDCKAPCASGFKMCARLPDSGVYIYQYNKAGNSVQTGETQTDTTYVFHHKRYGEVHRNTVISELNKYKPKCLACRCIIRRARSLLEKFRLMKLSQVSVICDYCLETPEDIPCKRCQFISNKFRCCNAKMKERQKRFSTWISNTKELLQTILHRGQEYCGLLKNTSDLLELERILKELYPPVPTRSTPKIEDWSSSIYVALDKMYANRNILRKIVEQLNNESLWLTSTESPLDLTEMSQRSLQSPHRFVISNPISSRKSLAVITNTTRSKSPVEKSLESSHRSAISNPISSRKLPIEITKNTTRSKAPVGKSLELPHRSAISNPISFQKLPTKITKNTTRSKAPVEKSLESAHRSVIITPISSRKSTTEITENTIWSKAPVEKTSRKKITLKTEDEDRSANSTPKSSTVKNTGTSLQTGDLSSKFSTSSRAVQTDIAHPSNTKGIFYQLSDKRFIDNGWTCLPTLVTMRVYNIYKIMPVESPYNWIILNREKGTVFYDTGEILAVFKEHGAVTWYYRNGQIALVYNGPEENNVQHPCMYMLYSFENNTKKKQTVLATFDYRGNGAVYDSTGKERLKYNQNAGKLFDKTVGSPNNWLWNNMNEPPVYEKKFCDTYEKNPDPVLTDIIDKNEHKHDTNKSNRTADVMLVEIDNYAKELDEKRKDCEMFEIQMKVLRINEFFTLKLLHQTQIYLIFNDGLKQFKLNLGFKIDCNDMLDKEYEDISSEPTPKICHSDWFWKKADPFVDTFQLMKGLSRDNKGPELKCLFHHL